MKNKIIILASIIIVAATAYGITLKAQNRMTVTNNSAKHIIELTIQVCGKKYIFKDIAQNKTQTQSFIVNNDGSFEVECTFKDQSTLTQNFGYVTTPGYGNKASIKITDESIIGTQN